MKTNYLRPKKDTDNITKNKHNNKNLTLFITNNFFYNFTKKYI